MLYTSGLQELIAFALLHHQPAGTLTNRPFGFEIGFTTNNAEETVDKTVKAGALALEKAKRKPHGQTIAYVKDPDGFLIEICTPIG